MTLFSFNAIKEITKFRVNILVAITAVFGYMIGSRGELHAGVVFSVFAGGFLITATAHIINQLIEVRYDKLMARTCKRPLVTGEISRKEAVVMILMMSITGLFLLYFNVNFDTAFISLVSLIMYSLIYTPMKRLNRLAVWIGAIPGALPVLIGYMAATNHVNSFIIMLFFFQVLWQLPHFWSIVWYRHEEYEGAGYDLLPVSGGRSKLNALWTALSSVPLLILTFLFYRYQYLSGTGLIFLLISNAVFMFFAYRFMDSRSKESARRLTHISIVYLPVMQFVLLLDYIYL